MELPEEIGPTCKDPECWHAPVIAGWCPGHAIARYKRQALRAGKRDEKRPVDDDGSCDRADA